MQFWSDLFYGKLLEGQLQFARSMDQKHGGKMKRLIKAWKTKNTLPIYQEVALHKVYEEIYSEVIPKSTASEWLSVIPDLLENKEKLDEFMEEKKKVVKKDERLYTYEEWEYLHNLGTQKLSLEYRTMMEKLLNPNLPDQELMRLTGASHRLIKKIINHWITMSDTVTEEELKQMNEKILAKWKQKILDSIEEIDAHNFRDLKALSWILDESFKQNRLLEGKSTGNIWISIGGIYQKILDKSQNKLAEWIQEAEIEFEEDEEETTW